MNNATLVVVGTTAQDLTGLDGLYATGYYAGGSNYVQNPAQCLDNADVVGASPAMITAADRVNNGVRQKSRPGVPQPLLRG